ncbi:undecaprenyl phosphate N,N'-diacetylbacillosamine 1-phosphate transferase [Tepidanaerobacter syntrophicus]|uniref:sugar transferase n=1 Tax=Tepidanaerobacter syntrophicus TaxID=224999 RepID=UPI0022EF1A94|nr:sugar transferase [Tepidanaerobacter syntrophicus]GLI51884.1 undecaprenyl phosphate N,N'-diacetylbacillosamine 1-phosphate transferase [Tepidanaerobacter syntrophicus]
MYRKYIKRLLDYILAIVLLAALSPIMLLAAIAIKLEDPKGPALFKQKRAGKDAKIFEVYKFRTMKVETEQDGRKLSDMERLTKVGSFLRKTSIDELPQLFNIIRGEMSFIGPRPLLPRYLPYYTQEEMKRHKVRPGISGLAQVNGRNNLNWEKRFAYDVYYVENISLMLDIKVFLLTILKVIKKDNIVIKEKNRLSDFDLERRKQIEDRAFISE